MTIRGIAAGLLITASTLSFPLAASAEHDGNRGDGMQRGLGRTTGIISSVQGSSVTLQDGRTLFLRQGTIINPTGISLAPGMAVTFSGTRDGRGRLNASEIDIAGNGNLNGRRRHHDGDRDNHDRGDHGDHGDHH